MKILLDGPISGTYSLAIVNREFAKALIELGQDVYLTQRDGPDPHEDSYFLSEGLLQGRYIPYAEVENFTFDIHSKNDWPVFAEPKLAPVLVSHCYAWEETIFPINIALQLEKFDGIFTTSQFTSTALRASGYTGQTTCIGNGVDHLKTEPRPSTRRTDAGRGFRFLHISSGLLRKGMDIGIKAFLAEFSHEPDVKLIIKTHYNEINVIYGLVESLSPSERKQIDIIDDDLSHQELQDLMREADFCFFPSRGEGFLLPAAEAMVVGTPVCVTECGGNQEFCTKDTALIIPTKLHQARSHVTAGKSAWLEAKEDDIRKKLRQARRMSQQDRLKLTETARDHIGQYTWSRSARNFLAGIEALMKSHQPGSEAPVAENRRRVAVLSTYHQRCGISTYSETLVRHMARSDLDIHILSEKIPSSEITVQDEDNVHRVWHRGKNFNQEAYKFIHSGKSFDTLIVQHHPGIISWEQLTKFVKQSRSLIDHIVVEIHSTAGNQDHITQFADAMKSSGSIIVHNCSDYIRIVSGLSNADNVLLFPHPVDPHPSLTSKAKSQNIDLFAFGICLPHKQFEVIAKLLYNLRLQGYNANAKVVTSVVPNNEKSIKYAHDLWLYKELLDLGPNLEFVFDFLPIDRVIEIASSCDIAVFPYAEVNEGASGAARVALSARLAVVTSNSSIFEDMDGICRRLDTNDITALTHEIIDLHRDATTQIDVQDTYIAYSSWQKHIARIDFLVKRFEYVS